MKRFVVAVFKHETNTFSPVPTPWSAFGRYSPSSQPFGDHEAIAAYRGTKTPAGAYLALAKEVGAEVSFPISAYATPGGPAEDEVIDRVSASIIDSVTKGADAVFLDLHGGMATKRCDDPEGELLRRIRAVAPSIPIAVSFDFHGNLSQLSIDNATVIAGYRTYPHVDTFETGLRAGRTLLAAMAGKVRPVIVWHSLPILSHLNCQTPSRQPMKDIMDRAIDAEEKGTVLNASVFGCFPLADNPHVGMHGVIVADEGRLESGHRVLYELMSMAWERRAAFVFKEEPWVETIARAKAMPQGPIVLADHGDVAGSGGSTDVMAVLAEVMRQGLEDVCAGPFWDPAAVARMEAAGVGARITTKLGGNTDFPAIGEKGVPLEVTGTVREITDGAFTVTGSMTTGAKIYMGRTAVLDTGSVELLVSERRHEPIDVGCFTHAGIRPADKKYILIKSRQHFRAGFESIAREILMVAGPGICTSDYSRFPWKAVRRPIFPLDPDVTAGLGPLRALAGVQGELS